MAATANVSQEILEVGGKDLCRAHVKPSSFPVEATVVEVDKNGQHVKKNSSTAASATAPARSQTSRSLRDPRRECGGTNCRIQDVLEEGSAVRRLRVLMMRVEILPGRLAGATTVVVDAFLATTTLLTIFENGARRVFPVASLEEAEEEPRRLGRCSARRRAGRSEDRGLRSRPLPRRVPARDGRREGHRLRDHQRHACDLRRRRRPIRFSSAASATLLRLPVTWRCRRRTRST